MMIRTRTTWSLTIWCGENRGSVTAVASGERSAEDRERDLHDRPAQVLAFFGIRSGDRVFDMNAATGYYSELLARVVGPRGHVIAHNHPGALTMLGADALSRRYRDGRLPTVEPLVTRHQDLALPPRSLDAVLMSMVYHDTCWQSPGVDWGPINQQALLKHLFEALRPGGVIGVIDNVAVAGAAPEVSVMALHRIDPAIVRRDFLRAGFVLEAESDLLRHTADDHSLSVFDPATRNQTDRFVMRFLRPAVGR